MYSKRIFFLGISIIVVSIVRGQTLYIQQGKKKIKVLPLSEIEIRAFSDSSAMEVSKKNPSFIIKSISTDSIVISKPTAWKDTFGYKFNILNGKDNLKKKRYYRIPSQYEYQKYSLKEISKIRYRYQRDQSGEGCVGCIFIPGLNVYYFWSKAYKTKMFDMTQWNFVWK